MSAMDGHPRDLLSDYVDDELSLEARTSVDRHLASCEGCRDHLESLRRIARGLSEERLPPVPIDLEAKIARRIDAATTARRRLPRFALPLSIAATIGAVGLLIAVQWRQGHLGVPPPVETKPEAPAMKELGAPREPAPPPPARETEPRWSAPAERQKKEAAHELLDKDAKLKTDQLVEGARERDLNNEPVSGREGVTGGVVGGVAGGVEREVEAGASVRDERLDREAARKSAEPAGAATASALSAPTVAAKGALVSGCADRWSDSGVRGRWQVPDVSRAAQDLDRIARDVAGASQWRGIADGRPYLLIVPRSRFDQVYDTLRARGVQGLEAPPTLGPGDDCAAISIGLAPSSEAPPPSPR